jgi:hypothetical protein
MKFPRMKNISFIILSIIILLFSCRTPSDFNQVIEDMQENLDLGNLSIVIQLADSIKKLGTVNINTLHITDSLRQIAERINIAFSVTEKQADTQIEKLIGPVSPVQRSDWEKNGMLEYRMIDGCKRYFERAVSNLLLLKKFRENKEERLLELSRKPDIVFRLKHVEDVYKYSNTQSDPVLPVSMKITYSITVHPDVVPAGEMIRCWLPWPKEDYPRQSEIKLLTTSNPRYLIAPDTAIHRTIYMEEISEKGVPVVFQISFAYTSSASYFNPSNIKIQPYDKKSHNYQKFTKEQLPHICFNDVIKHLADSICGNDDNPVSVVRKIYYWFKDNIPWTAALEYSIIPNIPDYVISNRRGDCGMQTFLFLSMLRYKGIPVRWQSGWMVPPDAENLHDWCEVYYEGTGWVPVDVSYDLMRSENQLIKNFYFSGIDSYRLIVNDGVAGPLHPEKKFLRSEPYDFQRGEVEWKEGNLYFDKWDYDMKIEYINAQNMQH